MLPRTLQAWHRQNSRRSGRFPASGRETGRLLVALLALFAAFPAQADLGAGVTLTSGVPAPDSGDPTLIYPSEVTNLVITLSNDNEDADLTSVGFSNSLPGDPLPDPDGLKVAAAASITCFDPDGNTTSTPPGSPLSAPVGGQTITLSNLTIPDRHLNPASGSTEDGFCSLVIPVTAGTSTGIATAYEYVIASGAVTGNDGSSVANIGETRQSVNVRALDQPTITKSFSDANPVLGGDASTLTITIANPNTVIDLADVSVTDAFPTEGAGGAIIKVAATPNASTSGCGGSATFSPASDDVSISASNLEVAAGGSCTLQVDVVAAHTNAAYATSELSNRIDKDTDFSTGIGLPAAADASADVQAFSPLSVDKQVSPSSLAAGTSGTFTITLTNSGNTDLTIASFSDDPIDGVGAAAFGLTVGAPSTDCTGGSVVATDPGTVGRDTGVTLTGGTIPANGSCTLTIPFTGTVETANTPRSYTNSIPIGAVDVGNAAIFSQARSAAVTVYDTFNVSKTALPANPAPGNPVRYQVTVENWSTATMNSVVIDDTLGNGQTFLSGTIAGNDFTPSVSAGCGVLGVTGVTGDTNPVLTIGSVPARSGAGTPGSCSVTFWAMTDSNAADGASFANQLGATGAGAGIGSVCYDPGSGSVCYEGATISAGGNVDADVLTVAKSFSPAGPLPEGSVTRMRVELSNLSANALGSLAISDTLPVAGAGVQMVVANPANAATTCGGTITAVAGNSSVSLNGGSVPARAATGTGAAGSCRIEVDVSAPAGSYSNTATATGMVETYANNSTQVIPDLTASAGITFTSSLSASKAFSPAAVSSGGRSTVTIRLSNAGTAALTGVALIDHFTNDGTSGGAPNGMLIADPANASTTCAGTTSIGASPGAGTVTLSGADIVAGASCDLRFDVVATGTSNWVNTIPVNNITADGGVFNQTPITATLNYQPPSGITVGKVTSPSTLTFPGQVSRLTISLFNGTQDVTGLAFSDHFTSDGTAGSSPNGMRIASSPAASTDCPGGIVTATAGATSVAVSGVSLLASASCTVAVNVSSTAVGGITNIIPAAAISTDQGLSNASAASTSLVTQANVGVTKAFIPEVIKPGERSRLRVTLYNPTDQPATNLSVSDPLPAGVSIPAGPNPSTTCSGGSVSVVAPNQVAFSGGNLPRASGGTAASCYFEVDVTAPAEGDFPNTIPAGNLTANIGGITVTNSQPASATLRAKSPLVVHLAIDSNTLDSGNPAGLTTGEALRQPGDPATLTILIQNPNAAPLTGAAFTDLLPDGVAVAQTPNASTTCAGGSVYADASATSVRLAGATIPASGQCSVTLDVISNNPGSYTNTLSSGAITTAEGVSNEEPTSARLVISTPPTVAKEFSPAIVSANGTSTLTIVLGNENASAIILSSALTDTLPIAPGAIVVATPPNVGGTCPGAVTAVAGGGTVSYASGATIPAGGCTVSVDVTGATAGEHINSIPAGALQTSLGSNQQAANASLTLSTLGFITGRVFADNDVTTPPALPQAYDAAVDTPLAGTTVELRNGADCSGSLADTTTTDALGNYAFTGLSGGTYSVCQPVQPSGTLNAEPAAGVVVPVNASTGSAGAASNPSASSSQVAGIVLNSDGGSGETSGSTGNNFVELLPSSLSGTVFRDADNDGTQDGADQGLAGVTINLSGNDYLGNPVSLTTTTDADGNCSFTGLPPGNYTLTQPNQPAGTSSGITTAGAVGNGGTSGTASGVGTTPSTISSIVLPPNTVVSGNNFAELNNGRTLSGRMFVDFGDDGSLDGSDYGIAGQTLNLTGTDINGNAVTASTTTAADGSYSFTGLPPGTYTLVQPGQPAGTSNGTTSSIGGTASNPTATTSRITGIDLSAANSVENNFAEKPVPAPDLTLSMGHSPDSLAAGSSDGFLTITPNNIGAIDSSGTVTISDTLPAGLTPLSASGPGWNCTITGQTVSCTSSDVIAAGGSGQPIQIRVKADAGLTGQLLSNTATVAGGGEPAGLTGNNSASDVIPISDGASIRGRVWTDSNHDDIYDPGSESGPSDWVVELLRGGQVVASTTTGANGSYTLNAISPGSGYSLRFRHPETGNIWGAAVTNEQGANPNPGTRDMPTANAGSNSGNPAGATLAGDGTLSGMTLLAGDNIVEQSLPLDPAGVVYDSVTRQPVAGAVVTISGPPGFNPASHLVGGSATATTGSDGIYQFLLTPTAPSGTYTLEVTTYPGGYLPEPSSIIPVCSTGLTVNNLPNPARVQASASPPAAGTGLHDPNACPSSSGLLNASNQASTQYYLRFVIAVGTSADLVNNHIPIDPVLGDAIALTKTTPLTAVSIGQLVPYTIEARNTLAATLRNIDIRDTLPPGFKYRTGSATLDGVASEPVMNGRQLTWSDLTLDPQASRTIKMLLVVGSGVQSGEYVNRARAFNNRVPPPTSSAVSNEATATVQVIPDPLFDCSDLIGKVFDDDNANGYQDQGEKGIADVRLATARGWLVKTDAEGRFHIACAVIPDADRGSNFVMKLDERTLPSGYRLTTENPRAVRLTRGKLAKLNFGAALHRVVRIDMTDAAFVPGENVLRAEWSTQIEALMRHLGLRPGVLRLAYTVGTEGEQRARERLEALSQQIAEAWGDRDDRPRLRVEHEIHVPGPAGEAR